MKQQHVAILLTCHNRKHKTLLCLSSLSEAAIPEGYAYDIYLTDDGSTDGTTAAVLQRFPQVNIIAGNGNLFWAGGMRAAWQKAIEQKDYDAFLLLNDDVKLDTDFWLNLMKAEMFSLEKTGKKGIYSGATIDAATGKPTYGSSKIRINHFIVRHDLLTPTSEPQACEITNANVLWVDKQVVEAIGILDSHYTHGIADYDYSLKAVKAAFPVYLAPNVCGVCGNDHGNNWKKASVSLKERIVYLKSPKGLAYNEYLYYIRKHFPLFLPYSFVMLWLKTFFPSFWDKYKVQNQ